MPNYCTKDGSGSGAAIAQALAVQGFVSNEVVQFEDYITLRDYTAIVPFSARLIDTGTVACLHPVTEGEPYGRCLIEFARYGGQEYCLPRVFTADEVPLGIELALQAAEQGFAQIPQPWTKDPNKDPRFQFVDGCWTFNGHPCKLDRIHFLGQGVVFRPIFAPPATDF